MRWSSCTSHQLLASCLGEYCVEMGEYCVEMGEYCVEMGEYLCSVLG